jgi:uncharacterized membrane protein
MRNVTPFRNEPGLPSKAGVSVLYVVLGWIVATSNPALIGGLLWTFLIMGVIAWALFLRKRSGSYFLRYHIVQALMLNMALGMVLWLTDAVLRLLASVPLIDFVGQYLYFILFAPINIGGTLEASAKDIVVLTIALVMAFYSIRGRYTELPWVTDGVRNWV